MVEECSISRLLNFAGALVFAKFQHGRVCRCNCAMVPCHVGEGDTCTALCDQADCLIAEDVGDSICVNQGDGGGAPSAPLCPTHSSGT